MITVTLYTKKDCSLCAEALENLESLRNTHPHNLALVDIDADPELKKAYSARVPVLQAGPYTLEAPFDKKKIAMTLGAASDRLEHIGDDPKYKDGEKLSKRSERTEGIGEWFSRNYLSVLNLFVFLYVALPFLAPVLMNAGMPQLARPIYTVYGAACHQMAFRSWFLFGEQAAYPRAAANVEGVRSYAEATGLSEEDFLDARAFVGNEELGYKVAFCQRDVAIYGAILAFGLLFGATGRRIRSLHWSLWLLIGVAPIAFDGFSQLLSQIPALNFIPYRESTPLLRTLTGALFGFTTAWFGIPLLEADTAATRVKAAAKRVRSKPAS